MAAISSTIKQVYEKKPALMSMQMAPCKHSPVLLLDSGHQPYSSRYLFQTLRCVSRTAEALTGRRAVAVVSTWRCSGAKFKVSWCWPPAESDDWKTVVRMKGGDALDIIDIDLS